MPAAYYVSVTLHVLAAMLWLGGMGFLAVVAAPELRTMDAGLRRQLFDRLGARFRTVGWWCIAVLLVTGAMNLFYRGFLRVALLTDPIFWRTDFGRWLAVKLAMVVVMVVVSAVHDFRVGPAAGRAALDSPDAMRLNHRARALARVNALAGLVLVVAATRLARGG